MKQISFILLLVGIFQIGFLTGTRADVLDNWTTNQISTNTFGLHHVVYGNGGYVAVGEYDEGCGIYTSSDGLNWTLCYSDNNGWGLTLTYSGGRFVGVGGWETAVSTNGTNWAVSLLPVQYAYNGEGGLPSDMTYGNGVYVEVGSLNGVGSIITSPDGSTWTPRTSSPALGGPIASVTYGLLRFVAVENNDGYEYTSTLPSLGTTWTRRSIPGGNKISYANGLFIVPLNNKTNLISVDGINWSLNYTGLTNMLGVVTYGNGLFMAQCGISYSGSYLATSTDGTNWIQYARPLPNSWTSSFDFPDPDVSLATDGTRLVTVGAVNTNAVSYNGFVFTSDVLVGVRMTNNPTPKVALSGLVGRNYQIQSVDALTTGSSNWRTNATLQLTNTPYVGTDATAPNSARFYRGVLLP
jgi:hypothetical protein